MKKIVRLLGVSLVLIFFFSACSVEKRRYVSGYNVQWKNSKSAPKENESIQRNRLMEVDKIISTEPSTPVHIMHDDPVEASADNSILINGNTSGKSNYNVDGLPEECDVIMLKNGDEIKAKVTEITRDEIKYKKCGDIDGQTYTLKKSEVFTIKYPNGTKEVIAQDTPAETENKPIEKKESGVFGILSLVFAIIGLAPLAIIFGAIGMGKRKEFRGLAKAGLIIGIITIIFIVILIIALSSMSFGFGG